MKTDGGIDTSGQGSDAKIIKYNLPEAEGHFALKSLSNRHVIALVASANYISWKTRHLAIPDDLSESDNLQSWVDDLIRRLMMDVNFCEEFINCIENDYDVKAALRAFMLYEFNNNPDFGGTSPRGMSDYEKDIANALGLNPDCNQDNAYGALTKLVDDAFQRIYDLFERIELVTDNQEMIVEYIDLIPGIGLIADEVIIPDAVSFFDSVRSWMNETFAAEDTLEVRKEIVCDLFCLYQLGCKITINQIYQYFKNKVNQETPYGSAFDTVITIFNFLNGHPDAFTGIMWVMLAAEFGYGTLLGSLFGATFNKFKLANTLGEPSDDWQDDCDTCPDCYIWDFALTQRTWEILDYGTYGTAAYPPYDFNAFIGQVVGSETKFIVRYEFNVAIDLKTIRLVSFHADMNVTIRSNNGTMIDHVYQPYNNLDTIVYIPNVNNVTYLEIECIRNVPDGYIDLQKVKITYQGNTPHNGEAGNCG